MSAHAARNAEPLHTRPASAVDLERVIALDRAHDGRSRRGFFEKRWQAIERSPQAFIAIVTERDDQVAGFVLAHLLDGEFGGEAPVAVLDAIGVDPSARGHGLGAALLAALTESAGARGARELRTQAEWDERGLLDFFAHAGFRLAPRVVLERAAGAPDGASDRDLPPDEPTVPASPGLREAPTGLLDDEPEARPLARDRVLTRSLDERDAAAIVRIDERITGRHRGAYFERKLAEVLHESGVRVSLVAEVDGSLVGFVMARVDYGDFGQAEPTATIDTIGVDPAATGAQVGRALISQLLTNLDGLRVEVARTEIDWRDTALAGFLHRCGFEPAQRLAFTMRIAPRD